MPINKISSKTSNCHVDHPDRVGVMLVNLGTPESADRASVRDFLAEFLSDSRVIELNPWLWKPILHGIILRTRPRKVAEAYQKIWIKETNESPLRSFTRRQCEKLTDRLSQEHEKLKVSWAMRYGDPSISETLSDLVRQGCRRILVAPLYPQYSATTTASVNDKVFDTLKSWRLQPTIRIMPPYYDHPRYIEILAEFVEKFLKKSKLKPDVLLASFHGLPQENVTAGDPYFCHCSKTTRLLREHLNVDETFLKMTFQSRFGPKQWLQPYTDHTLVELAKNGKKRVAVISPGFAADCLETLEELNIRNRKLFINAGGRQYDYIPCLNDSPSGVELLRQLIITELGGWI